MNILVFLSGFFVGATLFVILLALAIRHELKRDAEPEEDRDGWLDLPPGASHDD